MILFHGIHKFASPEPSILDYGELAIGAGTFLLGIVVAISTGYTARRSRRIHVADKRMEWVTDFRNTISELISVAHMASPPRPDNANELLERFITLRNKIALMGLSEEGKIMDAEHISYDINRLELYATGDDVTSSFERLQWDILNKSQSIINEKWDKIKGLKK
ncbi:hypothetical protein [Flagellimonas marinaquae]|uniref:hypothetical protein n=1 Tax=Flagellimonas marinaquae TaxID=254955 RepID=UPI000F8E3D8F|nr:hypothetical protein [Allomuricauda aquimarina]